MSTLEDTLRAIVDAGEAATPSGDAVATVCSECALLRNQGPALARFALAVDEQINIRTGRGRGHDTKEERANRLIYICRALSVLAAEIGGSDHENRK